MKKRAIPLLLTLCLLLSTALSAQINIGDKIKSKSRDRVDNKTDQGVDKGLDKVEEGVIKVFRKKGQDEGEGNEDEGTAEEEGEEVQSSPESGKPEIQEKKPASLKLYSKFDFIPGQEIIFFDDFEAEATGNFPSQWNTNASGEVVTLGDEPGKWFKVTHEGGNYFPEFNQTLPDNFTIEFDIVALEEDAGGGELIFTIYSEQGFDANAYGVPGDAGFEGGIGPQSHVYSNYTTEEGYMLENSTDVGPLGYDQKKHVSIWVQQPRIRVYIDETKVFDIPRGIPAGHKYNRFRLNTANTGWDGAIDNLRIAVGAPDTRNQLLKDGKLVTRGILFDSGSDVIRPESYGVVKDISTILKENPELKVRIVGHTDSDGSEQANLQLSQKRAAAVKKMLQDEFGIGAARMETDGKGESEPVSGNDNAQGKANNRRVEFIRI